MTGSARLDARIDVRRGASSLDDLGVDLDTLFSTVGVPVTARRRWLDACAREQAGEPFVIAVWGAQRLVAAAALAMSRRRGITRIVAVGHGCSDRTCLAALDDDAAHRLADGIEAAAASWRRPWRLRVEQLPRSDAVARVLADRFPSAAIESGDPCPVLEFDRGRDPSVYEQSGLRKQVRAGRNRLTTDGRTCEVEVLSDLASIESRLGAVRDAHRARDRELGRPSDLDDPAGLRLWDALVTGHARAGEVELVLLVIDGGLAAYGVVFLDGGSYRVWDARIDSSYGRYAPGHLLGRAMLDAALAHPEIECFDWGRGLEPYKRLIAVDLDEREDLLAWSSASARRVTEAPRALRRRGAELLDRSRWLRRAWVWVKRRTVARGASEAQR